MKQKTIAEKIGVHPVYLNSVIAGRRKPSLSLAIAIERASEGKYRAVSFRPDLTEIYREMSDLQKTPLTSAVPPQNGVG